MNKEERNIIHTLADVWNDFLKLPEEHPDDNEEFRRGIHQLQYMIMARETRRKERLTEEALKDFNKRMEKSPLQLAVEQARGGPTPPPHYNHIFRHVPKTE